MSEGWTLDRSRVIYLIRHGEYVFDATNDDDIGPPLPPLGTAQARLVAARLAGLPFRFDSVTSSTMTRAWETADVINESLHDGNIERSTALIECTPPTLSPSPRKEAMRERACAKRLDAEFAHRFRPATGHHQADLIVGHGNVIRYFVAEAMRADTRTWPSMSIANASVTIIKVRPDSTFSIIAVGDLGHIPPNLQSWGTDEDPQLVAPSETARRTRE